jgi:uncharacterized protein (DUF1697 family)
VPKAAGVQYFELLRGINVGGQNVVEMAGLRLAFEELGFADVATYIQSGNVLFRAPRETRDQLSARIESGLTSGLRHAVRCVLLTHSEVDRAWAGRGVLYFARLAVKASGSRLSRVVALPGYQDMTIRSWRTTTKLLALHEGRGRLSAA